MPMVYAVTPAATHTTNATPNTANDFFFVAAGTGRGVGLKRVDAVGRANALVAITGIFLRFEKWFTTASSGGTGVTPAPRDVGMQASKASAGHSSTTVTSGTGGPTIIGGFGFGAGGPGAWFAMDGDTPPYIESGSADSIDLFSVSATASMVLEVSAEIFE